MLCKRIIPCLDLDRGRVVKGTHFINLRDAGDPVAVAQQYDAAGADELVILDITASHENRDIMTDLVRAIAEVIFIPLTVGGGIRSVEDATRLIQAGAEKVSLNSSAVKTPELINQIAQKFGRCATVVNIDPRTVTKQDQPFWEVHIHGGRTPTGLEAVSWAKEVVDRGAGEIVLTSMDNDGTKNGYHLPLLRAVASAVNVPVVASGGAGNPEHFREAFEAGAAAALAAGIFHFGEVTIPQCKHYLKAAGIPIRLATSYSWEKFKN